METSIAALAIGKPVIATNVGSVIEAVGDFDLVVPPRDGNELSCVPDRVLWREASQWNSLAAAAPDCVRRAFALDDLARSWSELIQSASISGGRSTKI